MGGAKGDPQADLMPVPLARGVTKQVASKVPPAKVAVKQALSALHGLAL